MLTLGLLLYLLYIIIKQALNHETLKTRITKSRISNFKSPVFENTLGIDRYNMLVLNPKKNLNSHLQTRSKQHRLPIFFFLWKPLFGRNVAFPSWVWTFNGVWILETMKLWAISACLQHNMRSLISNARTTIGIVLEHISSYHGEGWGALDSHVVYQTNTGNYIYVSYSQQHRHPPPPQDQDSTPARTSTSRLDHWNSFFSQPLSFLHSSLYYFEEIENGFDPSCFREGGCAQF